MRRASSTGSAKMLELAELPRYMIQCNGNSSDIQGITHGATSGLPNGVVFDFGKTLPLEGTSRAVVSKIMQTEEGYLVLTRHGLYRTYDFNTYTTIMYSQYCYMDSILSQYGNTNIQNGYGIYLCVHQKLNFAGSGTIYVTLYKSVDCGKTFTIDMQVTSGYTTFAFHADNKSLKGVMDLYGSGICVFVQQPSQCYSYWKSFVDINNGTGTWQTKRLAYGVYIDAIGTTGAFMTIYTRTLSNGLKASARRYTCYPTPFSLVGGATYDGWYDGGSDQKATAGGYCGGVTLIFEENSVYGYWGYQSTVNYSIELPYVNRRCLGISSWYNSAQTGSGYMFYLMNAEPSTGDVVSNPAIAWISSISPSANVTYLGTKNLNAGGYHYKYTPVLFTNNLNLN